MYLYVANDYHYTEIHVVLKQVKMFQMSFISCLLLCQKVTKFSSEDFRNSCVAQASEPLLTFVFEILAEKKNTAIG